jgi:hypothetical protein
MRVIFHSLLTKYTSKEYQLDIIPRVGEIVIVPEKGFEYFPVPKVTGLQHTIGQNLVIITIN